VWIHAVSLGETKSAKGLLAKIKALTDDNLKGQLLIEMIQKDGKPRPEFNKFYRKVLSGLIQELRKEFVDGGYVKSDDFDVYLRTALEKFEEGKDG